MNIITKQEFDSLKSKVEEARSEATKAEGALNTLTAQLKNDYGCANLKEAKALLATTTAQLEAKTKEFNKAKKAYEEKWKQPEE